MGYYENKIALVQGNKIQNDVSKALLKGIEYCRKAKEMGADIVVFPEMWSIGYMPPFENAFGFPDEAGHERDIEQLRDYRSREVWGTKYRKVHTYLI